MKPGKNALLASGVCAAALFTAAPAAAVPVTVTKVGTWSSAPTGAANPGQLAQGGKFVITSTYDTAAIQALPLPAENDRTTGVGIPIDPTRYFRAQLTTPASFQLSVPLQGLGIVTTQNETDHYNINANDCGAPCGFARTAEIQFFDVAGTQFRGFEFESQFLPGTGANGLVFEIRTADVNNAGTKVTNSFAQMLSPNLGPLSITSVTSDVRSQDVGPSGGQVNRGVFLSDAVPVIAKAGPNLSYSASTLTVTTNAGTATVTDPVAAIVPGQVRTAPSVFDNATRQADNDLGAGRTDGQDFLTYAWTVGGNALNGTNATGTRINRIVQSGGANGPVFVNSGTRTVNDVNKTVGIADSGLTKTTDTKTWKVDVTEDMTGKTGSDTLTVSYTNALPTIANATATASGPGGKDLDFALAVTDPDLVINALIPDFEKLITKIFIDGIERTGFFTDLIDTGSQSVTNADLLSFGLGSHTFEVRVFDRVGFAAERGVSTNFEFIVLAGDPTTPTVPEPSSLALLGVAALGLAFTTVRRRRA